MKENELTKQQKLGEKQAKQKALTEKLQTIGSVEQKETQIKLMKRDLKILQTNIVNKESTLNSQDGKGRKQELHADRLRNVRKLVDTNRLILNEVQESVRCTVRYVIHWNCSDHLGSFRTSRDPLFLKQVNGHELFFAVSYSKPALVPSIFIPDECFLFILGLN